MDICLQQIIMWPHHHDCLYSRHFVLTLRQLKARETDGNLGINEEIVKVGREVRQNRESWLHRTLCGSSWPQYQNSGGNAVSWVRNEKSVSK